MEERPSVYVSELSRRGLARRRARVRRRFRFVRRLVLGLMSVATVAVALLERAAG
jgi:hypothetical protein